MFFLVSRVKHQFSPIYTFAFTKTVCEQGFGEYQLETGGDPTWKWCPGSASCNIRLRTSYFISLLAAVLAKCNTAGFVEVGPMYSANTGWAPRITSAILW